MAVYFGIGGIVDADYFLSLLTQIICGFIAKNEIVCKLYWKGDTGNLSKLCLAKIIWSENQRDGVDWMMDLFGLMKFLSIWKQKRYAILF